MNTPDFNFNPEWPGPDPEIRDVLLTMAHDGSWGRYHGPHCQALLKALQEFHSVPHCHLTCSGTAAVELALRACGVGQGDEVVLSAYDFKANFVDVLTVGATPVLIDVLPEKPVIDAEKVESAVSPATKAILVSHLHGFHAPMNHLRTIAQSRGLAVIEDACQNPGALVDGRVAGTWGDVGVLSFGGSKLLSAGRGGAILTSRSDIAQRLQLLTQRGNDAYPLSEMQAAVLLPQLRKLPVQNERRTSGVEHVLNLFSAADRIVPIGGLKNSTASIDRPAYYKLPFLVRDAISSDQKNALVEDFHAASILLSHGFSALNRIHARSRFRAPEGLANAEDFASRVLTLHHPVLLQASETLDRLAARVRQITSVRL
jgi:perosamine synthetase